MSERARAGRSWTLQGQLLWLAVLPVVVASAIFGLIAYRKTSDFVAAEAMRAVGIVAQANKGNFVRILVRQHDRASGFLRVVAASCHDNACRREFLARLMLAEAAVGASLEWPGATRMETGVAPAIDPPPLGDGQIAQLEPRGPTPRTYWVVAELEGARVRVRYEVARWAQAFRDHTGLGASGESFLVDADGFFLTPQRYDSHSGASHPIDAGPMLACLQKRGGEMIAPDYRGVSVVHGYRYVEEIGGGCIMAHIDASEALTPAREIRRTFAIGALGFAAIAVLSAVIVARRIGGPIGRLTARAAKLAEGDMSSPVPCEGPAEIATFGRTFGMMASSLQRSTNGISFLLDVSRVLSRRIDATDASIAEIAALATKTFVTFCEIDLVEGDHLHRTACAHRDPTTNAALCASVRPPLHTEGRWAEVLETGRTLRDPSAGDPVVEGLDARSFMLVPLRSRDAIVGLVVLATTDRTFDDQDVAIAEELANRVGAALDNARLYREAQEAAQARERFLSIASHELRTPLTALSLHVEGVSRMALEEGVRGRLEAIGKQVKRLRDLVDDLLQVTHLASGGLRMKLEDVELADVVGEVTRHLGPELARCGSTVAIQDHGEARGRWDRLRVEQIVVNLMSNAAKYGRGKPIDVELGTDGDWAFVLVRDHGIGIAEKDLDRIFERFERAVPERSFGGFGLGLWITRQIARALGGEITVTSTEGEGSTFTVKLPRRVSLAA